MELQELEFFRMNQQGEHYNPALVPLGTSLQKVYMIYYGPLEICHPLSVKNRYQVCTVNYPTYSSVIGLPNLFRYFRR